MKHSMKKTKRDLNQDGLDFEESENIKSIAFDIIENSFVLVDDGIKTNEDYAFSKLLEMCSPDISSPVDNCRQILTELRTFGNDPVKVKALLEKFKENLEKIQSKSEIRRLISRLLRVFYRTKKIKTKKGNFLTFDDMEG